MSSLFLHEMAYKTASSAEVPTIEMIYEGLLEFSDSFNNFNEAVLISDYKLMTENASLEEKSGFVSRVWEALKSLWEALKKRIYQIGQWITTKVKSIIGTKPSYSQVIYEKLKAFLELLKKGINGFKSMGKDGVQAAIEKIKNNFTDTQIDVATGVVTSAIIIALVLAANNEIQKITKDYNSLVDKYNNIANMNRQMNTATQRTSDEISTNANIQDLVKNIESSGNANDINTLKELMNVIHRISTAQVMIVSQINKDIKTQFDNK